MTIDVDAETANAGDPGAEHDHAWRKVPDSTGDMLVGEYRCDLCREVWSL